MSDEIEVLDINKAGADELIVLPGVGPKLAQRIVEYRETVHPFEEVIELTAVPGISEKMVRDFGDRVTVTAVLEPEPETEPIAEIDIEPEVVEMAAEEVVEERSLVEETAVPEPEPESVLEPEPELEPLPASEPAPLPASPPPPPDSNRAQRRGCLATVLGALFGAVLGTALTLAILAAINGGSLSFVNGDSRLRQELNTARDNQTNLAADVGAMGQQIEALTASGAGVSDRLEGLTAQLEETSQSLQDLQAELTSAATGIADLEMATTDLDERLTGVAAAAENFDTFLNNLRDLLFEMQGPPPTPMPTPTLSPTTAVTPTPDTNATPVPTSASDGRA
ncbi:MAG: helix-hairpin-helix domain-containing protein, partial [Anaerolineae bacterium]